MFSQVSFSAIKKQSIKHSYNFLIILLFISLQSTGCSSAKYTSENDPHVKKKESKLNYKKIKESEVLIRVLLDSGKNSFSYNLRDDYVITSDGNESEISSRVKTLEMKIEDNLLLCNSLEEGTSFTSIEISSNIDKPIDFQGKSYRGKLKFIIEGNLIKVVNLLDLEEYLCGVIPSELPVKNDYYEAVKAFTICARTYAITKIGSTGIFDVTNNTQSQVYGGYTKENPVSNKAVEETKGLVLYYKGTVATVYYSSTCGGYTEDDKNVFGTDLPYLTVIEDGDESFCSISPSYIWEIKLTAAEIVSRLQNAGLIKGSGISIEEIEVESRFESDRINELKITYSQNGSEKEVSIFGNNIRSIIRNNTNGLLKSNNFEITQDGDEFTIKGKGFGHGVGLCQWGAIGMAKTGSKYEQILEHYFPGTNIE